MLALAFGSSVSLGACQLSMSAGKGGDLHLARINTVTGRSERVRKSQRL
jgi:hypothetical protein